MWFLNNIHSGFRRHILDSHTIVENPLHVKDELNIKEEDAYDLTSNMIEMDNSVEDEHESCVSDKVWFFI